MEQKTSNQRGTFSLMCYLKKSKALKNGEIPVYMRVTVNGQAFTFSMQGSVLPSLWSQAKEKSKGKDKAAQELNHYIESVKSRLYKIHRELEVDGKPISAHIIKDIFLRNVESEEGKTLVEVHTEHNERCRKLVNTEYSPSTIYKFDASLKFLQLFMEEEYGKSDIPLSKLNENFIRRYETFLKTERGCNNNSAVKHLKIFKKVIRIALANDWIQKDPFASIHFRIDEVHVDFLAMEELETLINKELADICEIKKRLTHHVSRHSYATLCLANKVSMENVAKMLGHSSTRMTQHYARILDQSIAEDMKNLDAILTERGLNKNVK